MSSRTTLKTYFLRGASPTEAQFADLIDSTLIIDSDLVDNFSSTSISSALTANAGKVLNDSLASLDARVAILEGASTNYLSNYYTKSEVDSSITSINTAIDGKVSTSTFNTLSSSVSSITSSLSGKTDTGHSHVMADVTDLQSALDAKTTQTYVDNTKAYLEGLISAINPGGNYSSEIAALDVRITSIESESYATTAQLSAKASATHVHSLSDISDLDLSLYYDKTEVDVLLSNVVPKPHTHIENDITDLDKYTRAQTDLKFTDHNNLTNNPHNVTKAQVSLGNVENLSVVDLFATPQAQAFATDAELQAVSLASSNHISSINNPHNVTKAQVSLGNVPNVNFQNLLDSHLNASNPHNINLTYFDVYSRAETDTRIVHYIDTLRYAFKPTMPTDGAGAIGDIAYDNTGLYFKFGATDWRQILASKTFNDGSAGSKFEIETPKFEVTTAGGTNLFAIDSTTNTTNINTASVSIGGATNIDNTLNVTGAVSLGGSTFNVAGNTTNIASTHVSLGGNTLNVNGQVSLASGMTTQGAVSINNTLNVSAHSILSTLRATDVVSDSLGTGAITCDSLNAASSKFTIAANGFVNSTGGSVFTGGLSVDELTVSGTTTNIDTTNLLIEDNMVVLNKNQTGTPSAILDSGIEVERGTETNAKIFWDEQTDTWKCDLGGSVKTITFDEDAPATYPPSAHTHPWSEITSVPATFAPSSHTHPWSEITSIPATFTPSSHSHAWSEITSKPATFAPSSHSHAWSEITSVPATFAPSSHTHTASQITDFNTSVNTLISNSPSGNSFPGDDNFYVKSSLTGATATQRKTNLIFTGTSRGSELEGAIDGSADLGGGNIFIGQRCGGSVGTHNDASAYVSNNVAIGQYALDRVFHTIPNNTGCSGNVAVGPHSLVGCTGDLNTALGNNSGSMSGQILTMSYDNITALGNGATPSASNQITLGNSSVTSLRCNVQSITSLSDARTKKDITSNDLGLDFINSLNTVKFKKKNPKNWDESILEDRFKLEDEREKNLQIEKSTDDNTIYRGLIAQEVEQVLIDQEIQEWDGLPKNDGLKEIGYGALVTPLIKAVQELSAEVESLKSQLNGQG